MSSRFSILVVDEDPRLADTLNQASQRCFPEASFKQVYTVAQAKTWLENLTDVKIRLIILAIDEQHSGDDLDFLAFLRAYDETQRLPIFILTTSQLPCDLIASYTSYASSFNFRPYSIDDWANYLNSLTQYNKAI